jgi:hypothetical protein
MNNSTGRFFETCAMSCTPNLNGVAVLVSAKNTDRKDAMSREVPVKSTVSEPLRSGK